MTISTFSQWSMTAADNDDVVDKIGRKVGLAFGDAFAAGFGVSGRSALIPFIVVLVGAIVALVVAAIQAVNALIAVLTTIPAVLLAIGLQVGVVVLAFQGMGTAISRTLGTSMARTPSSGLNLKDANRKIV